jgi:hypothetical protein
MVFLCIGYLFSSMHATTLLLVLDFVHPGGGHNSSEVVFAGDSRATELLTMQ